MRGFFCWPLHHRLKVNRFADFCKAIKYSYFVMCGVMVPVAVGMLGFFRKKNWLQQKTRSKGTAALKLKPLVCGQNG